MVIEKMYTNGTVPVSDRALRLTGLRMARTHDRTTHKRTTHKKDDSRLTFETTQIVAL